MKQFEPTPLDADKMARLDNLIGGRSKEVVVYRPTGGPPVMALVRPAALDRLAEVLRACSELEQVIMAYLHLGTQPASDNSVTLGEESLKVIAGAIRAIDVSKIIDAVQPDVDVNLRHRAIPHAAVVSVVIHWIMINLNPAINGPFVTALLEELPQGLAELAREMTADLQAGLPPLPTSSSMPADLASDTWPAEETPAGSGKPA